MSQKQSTSFDARFQQKFPSLGAETRNKYSAALQMYQKYLIPFQSKRITQNQNLSFKNTLLQKQKLQLTKKAQQLSAEGKRQEYIMEKQATKINDLQNTVIELESANQLNLSQIQALRLNQEELKASLEDKINIVKQVEQDKQQVSRNYQQRDKQFSQLIQNYLRQKSIIVQKMNYINQLQQTLRQKQKQMQQKQFYLKKQWQKFEQTKKQQKPSPLVPTPLTRRSSSRSNEDMQQQPQPNCQKTKFQRMEILRNPVKKIIKHHNNQIYDLAFNYNGNTIATCGGDRMIKIYDVMNFRNGATIQGHSSDNIYLCLGLDYSGEKLLAGSTDHSVQVFSTSTGKQLHSFVGHGYKVNSVSWSSAKQKCVSGSQDKQIKVWQIQKASNILSIPCGKPVKYISCNSIQPLIYSGHSDGSIRLYSLNQNSTPIAQIKGIIDYPINSLVVLGNRSQILVSSQQGTPIYLLDLKMNKLIYKYEGKDFFNTLARAQLSPTEKYVIAGNCDGFIYYWNKDKQSLEKRVSGHETGITALKYHFLSNIMTTCDKQGNIIIWQ